MDLQEKIHTLPASPGVYLYKNAEGEVLYVGKANSLRTRVRSYFAEGAAENAKTGSLLRQAVDLDYIVVDNEQEALALKRAMVERGMSAAEIEQVLLAGRPSEEGKPRG